jgi:hypothetical protein
MEPHSSFGLRPPHMAPFALPHTISDPAALEAAAAAVQRFFADKKMPLIVAGRCVRCVRRWQVPCTGAACSAAAAC